ncbi:MAG TPA: MBL fold metallo-hydrolase [Ktedonobacterales bacterium]|jgi:Cft2 family RNA processing exonuclease
MQVVFLGGANGVGASCLALHLGGHWIVVDAGVRVDKRGDPLPDLALLDGKQVQAIFVTHAHADHIGALPLVHQAFPKVPIFASRATMLLMEVMLADALKIMSKRAAEELETPLYPERLVAGMLEQVRPLPTDQRMTLSQLPGVTVEATRAGHVAGAVSLGFTAPDGAVVVSGDVSVTPQRTVLGASMPRVAHPDLLVLESTYGSRLHPNRQAEEQRLAQGVADGIARGGHVLVPCFALGRAQEILLVLQAAQQKGEIPPFPIWVDGLVRRVCATYRLIPEALTPTLQRQIRRGYDPFIGPSVRMVQDEREREQILAGSPACIVSSSGMLTGGPSAWFAQRLASRPEASILITGYQDEEAPGKRLLDLAEHKTGLLELNGVQIPVACQVAKYSLSAHADGGELAALAELLKPATVALVHGDPEARAALQERLVGAEILLPENSSEHEIATKGASPLVAPAGTPGVQAATLEELPQGIGLGVAFDLEQAVRLWAAVSRVADLETVTARQLALIWYGDADDEHEQAIQNVLGQGQNFFSPSEALPGVYQVRQRATRGGEGASPQANLQAMLAGQIVLINDSLMGLQIGRCIGLERAARVLMQWPEGIRGRARHPLLSISQIVGAFPPHGVDSETIPEQLADLIKRAKALRRRVPLGDLARKMEAEHAYTLDELCPLASLNPEDITERLALALVLARHPRLFTQQAPYWDKAKPARTSLNPHWQEAVDDPAEAERPDQVWIMGVVERHLGNPPGLYRRSIDPQTGEVTLAFQFPDVARPQHAGALAAAAAEAGVEITISPKPHQGALVEAAQRVLPEGLTLKKAPSLLLEQQTVRLAILGMASPEARATAQQQFKEETGWQLEYEMAALPGTVAGATSGAAANGARPVRMEQNAAQQLIRQTLGSESGLYKIGIDGAAGTLTLRFNFPAVAKEHYQTQLTQMEQQTGWHIEIYPATNHGALEAEVRRLLPAGVQLRGAPSLHMDQLQVVATYEGALDEAASGQAQAAFLEKTGWSLELKNR